MTTQDNFIGVKVTADEKRLFKAASEHFYGEENISMFMRQSAREKAVSVKNKLSKKK